MRAASFETSLWLGSILLSGLACSSSNGAMSRGTDGGGATCQLAESISWSGTAPLIAPISDATHNLVAVKDPTVVQFNGQWLIYASSVSSTGAYSIVYTTFSDWSQASSAPMYYLDQTAGFGGYTAAPELFYFRPQGKWYLVYQAGPPMYSTTTDPTDPTSWTAPAPFFAATPPTVAQYGGNWLDFWVICDAMNCHLFFSDNHGRWYNSETPIGQFPNGFGDPVVALQDATAGRLFEASNVYKMDGTNQYLALIEAFDRPPTITATFAPGSPTASRGRGFPGKPAAPSLSRGRRTSPSRARPGRMTSATGKRSAPGTTRRSPSPLVTFGTCSRETIRRPTPGGTTTRSLGGSGS